MESTSTAYGQQNFHQRIRKRQGDHEDRRRPYDPQRDEIAELLRPDLVKGQVGQKVEGAFEGSAIVEGTAPYSVLVWQRGFQGNMVSRRTEWFRDRMKEPPRSTGVRFKGNDEVNLYCQDLTEHMMDVYQRSNYYDVMPQFILDGGTVASAVMLFEQDIVNDRMVCKVPDYAAVWLDKDIFGYDNCLHVKWEWNALEAAQFFGEKQLPRIVQEQLRNGNHYTKTEYLQVIYGAGDRIYDGLKDVLQTHPWMEHFICLSANGETEQTVLKPRHKGPGYFSRPFASWHYHRNWHEVYSRSPAWWAICDIKGNNAMWEAIFGEAELALRPPSWSMDALRGILNLSPGGDNWARSAEEFGNPPQFIERKTRYDVAMDFANRLQRSIERHYGVPMFMAVNQAIVNKQQPQTAFALMRAEAENTAQLAPQVETFENQVLSHTHDVFMDSERMAEPAYPWGRLPEPPDIVQEYSDGTIDVQFIGMLSMAQVRDREVLKFYRNVGGLELPFTLKPELINKIKWSQAIERVLEAGDFAQADIVPEDVYQAIEQATAQRQMQQELAESAPQLTKAVKNLQNKTKEDSPLAMMTGGRQ